MHSEPLIDRSLYTVILDSG